MSGISSSSRGSCHTAAPPSASWPERPSAAANTGFLVSGQLSLLPLLNRLTHSTPAEMNASPSAPLLVWDLSVQLHWLTGLQHKTPAEMNASPSPALMAWNAIRVLCSEEEQYRVMVVPGRWSWPSMIAISRAML